MLQIHAAGKLDDVESALRIAAEQHGGHLLAVSHTGDLVRGAPGAGDADAVTFTLCFSRLYAPLLRADIRMAAFLPSRIAAWGEGGAVCLEAAAPHDNCRLLHRPDLEPLAAPLEDTLRAVMEEAAHRPARAAAQGEHRATEEMVNMGAALPQRIDCRGSKLEELAGTGVHDAQGG